MNNQKNSIRNLLYGADLANINELFKIIIGTRNPSNIIRDMLDLGLDAKYHIDVLDYCYYNNDCKLAKYLIENIGTNITNYQVNLESGDIIYDYYDFFEMLLKNKIQITLFKNYRYNISLAKKNIITLFIDNDVNIIPLIDSNIYAVSDEVVKIFIAKILSSLDEIDQDVLNRIIKSYPIYSKLTLQDVKILVDPQCCNDDIFLLSCNSDNIEITKYLLHDCNCDINAKDSQALCTAMNLKNNNMCKFLIDSGIKISDRIITISVNDTKNLHLLLENGLSAQYIAKKIFSDLNINSYVNSSGNFIPYCKELVKYGVDFNEIILSSESNSPKNNE